MKRTTFSLYPYPELAGIAIVKKLNIEIKSKQQLKATFLLIPDKSH
jgi:hypothetical protein